MISFSDAILPPDCRISVDPCRVPVRCWWFEWASKVESLCSSFFHELHREWSPSNASVRDHSATEEFSYKKNYLTYIHLRWKKKESTKFTLISRSRIPAVINLIAEFSPIFLSYLTWNPTSWPRRTPSSWATLLAVARTATRRGCVIPITPLRELTCFEP